MIQLKSKPPLLNEKQGKAFKTPLLKRGFLLLATIGLISLASCGFSPKISPINDLSQLPPIRFVASEGMVREALLHHIPAQIFEQTAKLSLHIKAQDYQRRGYQYNSQGKPTFFRLTLSAVAQVELEQDDGVVVVLGERHFVDETTLNIASGNLEEPTSKEILKASESDITANMVQSIIQWLTTTATTANLSQEKGL